MLRLHSLSGGYNAGRLTTQVKAQPVSTRYAQYQAPQHQVEIPNSSCSVVTPTKSRRCSAPLTIPCLMDDRHAVKAPKTSGGAREMTPPEQLFRLPKNTRGAWTGVV